MSDLVKINDRTQFTNTYHDVQMTVEAFARLAVNIPRNLTEVVQHIYGRFDASAHYLYKAANTFDINEKIRCLDESQKELFYQFSSIELLVKARGMTPGGANDVLVLLKKAYTGNVKWLNSIRKI